MKWTVLTVALALCSPIYSLPVFEGESSSSKVEDILSQSELTSRLRRADESLPVSEKAASTTTNTDNTQVAESRSDEIVDVLKALNLPADFATPKRSVAVNGNDESKAAVPSPVASASSSDATISSRVARQYMTGNAMLDKIMNCPCAKEQLSAVGVKGVEYFNQPDPAIYREPPYGPDALGPGDVIANNLKSVGGKTGNVFGQVIRLLLGIPNLALSLLKPLIVGVADTAAQTTDAAAGVTAQAAKQLPVAIRSGAVVIKRLMETFGDVTGSLLHVFSNLIASLAAAKTSLSGTLPFAFDILGDLSGRLATTVGTAVDFISGTTEVLSAGVVSAAKTKGNLFSGLVEGAKGFQNGLLEGIKYGVNDEQPPADPNDNGWRR